MTKIKKWPKITFRGPIWVPKVSFFVVLGTSLVYKSGLRILIRAPKMPFLVPPKLRTVEGVVLQRKQKVFRNL